MSSATRGIPIDPPPIFVAPGAHATFHHHPAPPPPPRKKWHENIADAGKAVDNLIPFAGTLTVASVTMMRLSYKITLVAAGAYIANAALNEGLGACVKVVKAIANANNLGLKIATGAAGIYFAATGAYHAIQEAPNAFGKAVEKVQTRAYSELTEDESFNAMHLPPRKDPRKAAPPRVLVVDQEGKPLGMLPADALPPGMDAGH